MPGKTLPDLQTADEASSFLLSYKMKKPFLLAVGFHKPHIPLKYPKQYDDLYPLEDIPLPRVRTKPPRMPEVAWNPWNDLRRREDVRSLNLTFPFEPVPDDFARRIIRSYYSATTYMDDQVGKVIDALEKSGQGNTTAIIILGDHGWSLGEHGEWAKYSNLDVSLRVPLIITVPWLNHSCGLTVDQPIELLDVFPTIVDIMELPTLKLCRPGKSARERVCSEGRSFLPVLEGDALEVQKRAAFSQYPRPGPVPTKHPNSDQPSLRQIKIMGYTVRTMTYRYTEWLPFNWKTFRPSWNQVLAAELYDHEFDPDELNNVVGKTKYREAVKKLKQLLRDQGTITSSKQTQPPIEDSGWLQHLLTFTTETLAFFFGK
ncbi:unnamed protein product [Cyprideis torosa]|uniref:Uncharacterized protein n=1 Tax=Cyprideis torosa TaxID=163714 RepID=A0A7R8W8M1_9CRUS|nr:unnamed protein product [Cyprideis torosa]CAG0888724.1 unnamed protein product [Cyprideis torosa]